MKPSDSKLIRSNCVRLSMLTRTGLDYLFQIPVSELILIFEDAGKAGKGKINGK